MISKLEQAMADTLDTDLKREPTELEVVKESLALVQKVVVIQDKRLKVLEDWFGRIAKQTMRGDGDA